jgi:hypothetical protein
MNPNMVRLWGLRWGSFVTLTYDWTVKCLRYQRASVAGGTCFFTVNLVRRQ